jgi:hypothetical protein
MSKEKYTELADGEFLRSVDLAENVWLDDEKPISAERYHAKMRVAEAKANNRQFSFQDAIMADDDLSEEDRNRLLAMK